MKINNLTFILLIGVLLSGLMAAGYVSVRDEKETSRLGSQNQAQGTENYTAASISKGTILFLLAVGIIGVLGVSRKKRDIAGPDQQGRMNRSAEHQNMDAGRQESLGKKS